MSCKQEPYCKLRIEPDEAKPKSGTSDLLPSFGSFVDEQIEKIDCQIKAGCDFHTEAWLKGKLAAYGQVRAKMQELIHGR